MTLERIVHSGLPNYRLSSGEEIIFDRGTRGKVIDTLGNEYIDFILGYGPVIIGHNHPSFSKMVAGYLNKGIHLPGYTSFHDEYVNKLFNKLPESQGVCFFKTASEAITGAMRIAAIYTNNLRVIRCGYIGWHDSQLGLAVCWHEPLNSPLRTQKRFTENMRGVHGTEGVFNWISLELNQLEEMINANKVGAFIIDAYQLVFTDIETIKKAIHLCKQHGIVVIFDETKTGGRYVQTSFAIEHKLDVDMLILGKALANGAPLSLLVGDQEFLRLSQKARITGTYSKELLSLYCAMATLNIMELEDGYNAIYRTGKNIVNAFNQASEQAKTNHDVTAKAFFNGTMFEIMFSPELVKDIKRRSQLIACMADNGILLLGGHPSFICLDHQDINLDVLTTKFYDGLYKWQSI
jgi:glutamate-1-semialdehyde 2,1-aminomutase